MEIRMWEGSYGREPFDLRLTVLRLFRQLNFIAGVTLAGALIFGGGYCVKNILCAEKLYCAESVYHVEYAVEEEKDVGTVHINQTSWNAYLQTGEFLDAVQAETETGMSDPELAAALSAVLASDLRVPATRVTTDNPEKSLKLARAVETVMTDIFPGNTREVSTIRVIDPAVEAPLVKADVRPVRAFVLSAVLSCFFAVVFLLLKELGDDNIWLPATIGIRYGVKVVGTPESAELKENISYFFENKAKAAVMTVSREGNPAELAERLSRLGNGETEWFPVPSPLVCPESCGALRQADGILLAVKAGCHAGKQLEYVLSYLSQQDCKVTAVILCDADEWLIRRYYQFQKGAAI